MRLYRKDFLNFQLSNLLERVWYFHNDIITGGAGADKIDVGSGTDTVKFATVNAETQVGVVATGFTVSGDVITGMGIWTVSKR